MAKRVRASLPYTTSPIPSQYSLWLVTLSSILYSLVWSWQIGAACRFVCYYIFPLSLRCFIYARFIINLLYSFVRFHLNYYLFTFNEKTYIWYVILCFFAHILPKKKAKSLYPCQILNIKLIFKCNLNIWLIIKRKTKNRKFLYEKRIYWYFERKFKLFYQICNNLKEKQR